jgi:O-antigen ligase
MLALAAALALPFCLLYARAGAEIAIAVIDILFLWRSARLRDWSWARQPWFILGCLWWLADIIASAPIPALGLGQGGWPSLSQALVLGRLLLLAAALGRFVLAEPRARTFAWIAIAISEFWIALQCWQQEIFGVNIFGDHRWPDGALTGPFWAPRAGPPYTHLLFVVLLPVIVSLYARGSAASRIAAAVIGILGFLTSVMIGQRMPFLLAGLGLLVTALFLRPVRLPAIALGLLALALIPAMKIVSPPTFDKLVLETSHQAAHFAQSPYGELYTRAAVMIEHSPWHGYGFNGFLYFCGQRRFGGGLPALGIGPTSLAKGACNIHPHNFYLQAAVDAGIPGLILFAGMNLAWLIALARGLARRPDALRLGLFIGVLTYAWPLASTDNFAVLPMAGWLFLMLGFGLALTPSGRPEPQFLYDTRQAALVNGNRYD